MLSLPVLRSVFCGCSLEVGARSVAWVSVILFTFNLLLSCQIVLKTKMALEAAILEDPQDHQYISDTFWISSVTIISFIAVELLASLLLLAGVLRRNSCLVKPWLVLAFSVCVAVLALILHYYCANPTMDSLPFILAVVFCDYFIFYCFLVVYSFHEMIKLEDKVGQLEKPKHQQVKINVPNNKDAIKQ